MMETNQPAKPFLGVRFVLFGFNSIEESKIRYKIIDGGGVDSGPYNPNCTHVIVDKIVYDDPLCVAARKDCKTVVTGLWVDHSYDIGMAVDFTSVMYRPPKDLNGIPGAKRLVMCLTGYQRQDRDDIMTLVGLMGALFSKPLVANKVTHLICYKFEGEKYELGKKLSKIKLVNHRWLEDCLKEWEILPEANYNKSGYELEMMEAEAKDSEEEAEDTSVKPFAGENVQKSPCNLKPSFPQAHNSPKLSAETIQVRDPSNTSNAKDKSSFQGIDDRSERTSGLDDIPVTKAFGYHDVGDLKETFRGDLAQPHYQSPYRKHAANDLTPDSRRTEKTPHSDGKSGAVSYTRKIQRNLGELSSVHSGFEKETVKANDLSSSFSKQDQAKDVTGSDCFEPQKGNDIFSGGRPTVYSPQKSMQTSSYGTPKLQKIHSEVRPCIRKSLSLCDKILGVGPSLFDRLHDTGIVEAAVADNEITNGANPAMDSRSTDTLTLEPIDNADPNEKTSLPSSKRIKTSLSGFADLGDFDPGDSSLLAADDRDRNHRLGVKGSAASNQDRESDKHSSMNQEGDDNSNTKLLKKKTVARKTLGSRPKIASKANKKGFLYFDKRDSTQDEAVGLSNGQENEKSEQAVGAGLCYPTISEEAPKTIETKDASKSEDYSTRKKETLDDETETPEDKVEQVLDKVIEEVNAATVESAEKTDTMEEEEMVTGNLLKDVTASTHQTAGRQGIVLENVDETNISAPAVPKSMGDGLKRKNTTKKAPTVGKRKAKKVETTEGVESKEFIDAEVTCNKNDKVNEKENVMKAVKRPAAKSKHRKVSKSKSGKSAEEEKENTPVDSVAENKAEAKRGTKTQALKSDDTQLKINKSSEKNNLNSSEKLGSVANKVRSDSEPVLFILSGHRFQRREFQKVIRRLKGRFCRDSHQWSYQATHFIIPDPIRRTEKFFAAAASGRWILKTDYLTASNEAGKFLKEDNYEWHKNGLNEDGAINLEAPRKWRLLRQRTGHGALYGMRIIIYGECIAPPLDTLKRVVKAGDGTILATSPPYTRFLNSGVDFAVVSPGMPRVDVWVQEFLKHEVPCVVADYLVEYVCKPGYSLEKHILYNTRAWADRSFARLKAVAEEVVLDSPPPSDCSGSEDDVPCKVCGSRDRGDVMLICGDENVTIGCGVGCHIDCCDPPLEVVPEEDWFCSECSRVVQVESTTIVVNR